MKFISGPLEGKTAPKGKNGKIEKQGGGNGNSNARRRKSQNERRKSHKEDESENELGPQVQN